MLQNIIIIVILVACAIFIGRRMYANLRNSDKGRGCGCGCSGCGPDISSTCKPTRNDSDQN